MTPSIVKEKLGSTPVRYIPRSGGKIFDCFFGNEQRPSITGTGLVAAREAALSRMMREAAPQQRRRK